MVKVPVYYSDRHEQRVRVRTDRVFKGLVAAQFGLLLLIIVLFYAAAVNDQIGLSLGLLH